MTPQDASAGCRPPARPAELTIRFVDAEEGRTLNRDYRGKDYATNVLTFAYNEGEQELPTTSRPRPTSSCAPTCCRSEAAEQKKTVEEHAGPPGHARRAACPGLRPRG
jgi:rRNA maturation RNase YbeY